MTDAPLIYLPAHQREAANQLLQRINDKVSVYLTGTHQIGEALMYTMGREIKEAIEAWFIDHPYYRRFNIDFQLQINAQQGKISIIPSLAMQRLLAGSIVPEIRTDTNITLKGT